MEGRTETFTPIQGTKFTPGGQLRPWGQSLPLGAKLRMGLRAILSDILLNLFTLILIIVEFFLYEN
jgi:hypothetical protein